MNNGDHAKRRWLRRLAWLAAGIVLVLAAAAAGLMLYFNDAYFQARLKEVVRTELGRTLELRALHISLWNGTATLEGMRLLNAEDSFKDKDSLRIERASVRVAPWRLVSSGLKKVEDLNVQLDKPEIIVERRGVWPNETSNIDDLLQKLFAGPPGVWPKQTGLQGLSATLAVHGGSVLYRDSEERVGVSSIKDLEIDAAQPALGEPAHAKTNFTLVTPHVAQGGTVSLEGQVRWIEADGSINPAAFAGIAVSGQLKEVDVAQVARHLRKRVSVLDGKYRLTLGKPVSGGLKLEAPTLAQAHITTELESDGTVGVWQEHKRVAGNVPGRADANIQCGLSGGALQLGETHLALVLAGSRAALSGPQAARLLDLKIDVPPAQADAKYTFVLDARMDELFATDVGAVLGLKDRIGGKLAMKIDAKRDAGGRLQAEGKLSTTDGYVAVGNARQPTKLDVGFSANVLPDTQGRPERAEVSFAANADSFYVKSERPATITSLNEPRKLAAEARLRLHAGGSEFWKQFGPLLEVANMRTPLAEELDGELQAGGSAGKVQLQFDCTLAQQNPSPTPIHLVAKADYDGASLVDVPTSPYLSFDVQVKSTDKSLSLQLAGTATRGKDKQVVNLAKFQALGDLKAFTALNARFGAYVPVLFGPQYAASGSIKEDGTSQSVQTFAADGKVTSTTLNLTTDVQLSSFELSGPSLVPSAPPLHWTESEATLGLEMSVADSDAGTILSLKRATLHSTGLNLEGEMAEADLGRLKAAAAPNATPLKLWTEALPFTKLSVRTAAATLQKLQALGVLPADPLAAGDLALTAQHDPKTRRLKIELLSFENQTLAVKLAPTELDVSALAAATGDKTISLAKLAQALPALDLTATCKDEVLQRLQTRLGLPAEPFASGVLTLSVEYNPKTRTAALRSLAFAGPDLNLKAAATEIDVPALAALADQPKVTIAQWLQAAPACNLEVDAKPAAIQRLQKLKVLPPDPALAGEVALRGSLDRAARILKIESSTFNGTLGDLSLVGLALSTDRLGAFLDSPQKDTAAVAQLLPDCQLDLKAKAPLFETLQTRKLLPEDLGLSGTLNVKVRYNQAADRLVVENLDFARATGAGVPVISLQASGEVAAVRSLMAGAPDDPAKILAIFDKGLSIRKLHGDLGGLFNWLKRKNVAVSLAQDFQDGVYRTQGPLAVQDFVLRPSATPGMLDITASVELPLQWHLRPGPGQPPSAEPTLTLSGTCAFDAGAPLRLNLNRGQFAAQGTLNLDAAHFRYVVDKQFAPIDKAPGAQCGLKFDVSLSDTGVLQAPSIALAGGPVGVAITGLLLDNAKDLLRCQLSIDSFDLGKFAGTAAPAPHGLQLGCVINKLHASYDGAMSAFPKSLAVNCENVSVRVAATEPGKNAVLTLAGDFQVEPNRLASKNLNVALEGTGFQPQKLRLSVEGTPRRPGTTVFEALSKLPGLPLQVNVNVQAEALDPAAITGGLAALSSHASSDASNAPPDLSGIKELSLKLSASVPKVAVAGVELSDVKAPDVAFEGMKLNIKNAEAKVYGDGTATIRQEAYDLVTGRHEGSFEAANLNLHAILSDPAKPKAKDEYEVFGRLGVSGTLSGFGFDKAAMQTWKGNIKAQISSLVAQKNEGKSSGPDASKLGMGILGQVVGGKAGRALSIYSDDFGLFLNKLEFGPFAEAVALDKGIATIAKGKLAGTGKSAGLELDLEGAVDLVRSKFSPHFQLWLTKLPATTQHSLRLDKVDEPHRQAILKEFDQEKFQPVVLTGSLDSPGVNKSELLTAFNKLDDRIDELVNAKAAGETGPPAPGQTPAQAQKQPTPAQKKPLGGLLDGILK